VYRHSVAALSLAALLILSPCPSALASVDFSGRMALSTDSAGQSFLQVVISETSGIQSLNRVEDSETRYNALLDTQWDFDLSGDHRLLIGNRLRYGSTLASDRLDLSYRLGDTGGARLYLDSETDIERGEIFGRDETDKRQSFVARWVRPFGGSGDRLEAYGRAEIRRVSADTLFFPRSYNLGKVKVTWLRDLGILSSVDLGYAVEGVAVVDSASGSYLEHEVEGNLDFYAGRSAYVSAELIAARRDYVNSDSSAATGWEVLSRGTVRYSLSLALDVEVRPSLELALYDRPDLVYFDYRRASLDAGLKVRPSDVVGLEILPGAEMLRAPDSEREDYNQLHLSAGAEVLARGTWLDVSYRVGRRDYASPASRDNLESVPRSDYTFGELLLLAEKSLWRSFSLRATGSHNVEWHELKEDDVTVFLVSAELSYRF
jgi:hypothetical protein